MSVTVVADTGTWVSGDLPSMTINQQITSPPSAVDCFQAVFKYWSYTKPDSSFDSVGRPLDQNVCSTENQLGFYGGSGSSDNYSYIRPNTTYAFPVFTATGSASSVTPVPNQAAFITKDSSQSLNGEVAPHFFASLPSAGVVGPLSNRLALKVNQIGSILTDSAGTKIYMHAYAFSNNGRWMVIEARGLGLVRVDTVTRQMQLFDPTVLSYGQGFPVVMTLAISNDGNAVIKSGKNASDTYAYDLSGCQPGSFTIGANNSGAMQGCQKRALQNSLKSQLNNFQFLTVMRFSADGKSLDATAVALGLNNVQLYYSVVYSVAGYQQSHLDYLALGDSFSSGEGAYDYELGTNEPENTCHLSKASYPYLVAESTGMSASFHSVACSGALTSHYFSVIQYDNTPSFVWTAGEDTQSTFVTQSKANVITISMIGNDIGFGDTLLRCIAAADSCYHFNEDRQNIADLVHGKFSTLTNLYGQIKTDSGNKDNVKVYVLGYPQIVGDGPVCDINVPLSQEERTMARHLVTYLNSVIKSAAIHEGAQYVDVENAFEGHENCQPGTKAVNALSVDGDAPIDNLTLTHGSFHPNAYGQQLLAESLLRQSSGLTSSMPAASPITVAPYTESSEYQAFIGDAPSGGVLEHATYIGSQELELMYRASHPWIDIPHTIVQLVPNSTVEAWLNSTPTHVGTLATDANGDISGQITVPDSLTPGFHTLHLYGTDIGGQPVDLYQTVYVATSASDYNGDGVPNDQDPCKIVPSSGIDHDRDGIDDACDPEISDPPADSMPPVVTGTPDREPDYNDWYNHDVNIAWTAADPDPSSGMPTQPEATVADREGEQVYTSQQSCDPAGNCAAGRLSIKLDKTLPDIFYQATPEPNGSGWGNSPTTVTFACRDATSGINSCSEPLTVLSDGVYALAGTAIDNAGNDKSINAVVNLDSTAPAVQSLGWSANPKPYVGSSWLTVHASDNLSGITGAEYYIGDSDPGEGNGVAIPISDDNIVASFGADFQTGIYKVTVRVKDAAGNWSAPVSDYLVVYNPFSLRLTGNHSLTPSLADGDNLPGLVNANQSETAKFAFNVGYDNDGHLSPDNDFRFSYETGRQCGNPTKAQNCHDFNLDSSSLDWALVEGGNNEVGEFRGTAQVTIDGETQAARYRVHVLDAWRLGSASNDHLLLQIFPPYADINRDAPLYTVDDDVQGGNIHIES